MPQEDTIATLPYSSSSSSTTGSLNDEPTSSTTTTSLKKVPSHTVEVVDEKVEIAPIPDKTGSTLSRYLQREPTMTYALSFAYAFL